MSNIATQNGNPEAFCSKLSRADGESMVGTAATVDTWFLLEYSGTWTAKATVDNDLPRPVQMWLQDQLSLVENGRIQFIKQSLLRDPGAISFFVAQSREDGSTLYKFQLNDMEEITDLNIAALLSGATIYDENKRSEPLYLVCTNGKRDRCCSRVGLTLYQELARHAGDAVWQCTHLGGHRFAPTVVTYPDGTFYGRLDQPELVSFVRAHELGEIYLSHLRGRSCYDEVTQAAEYFLRDTTGFRERSRYQLLDLQGKGDKHWVVWFREAAGNITHRITLSHEMSKSDRVVSCSPIKAKPVTQFQLISHEIVEESGKR